MSILRQKWSHHELHVSCQKRNQECWLTISQVFSIAPGVTGYKERNRMLVYVNPAWSFVLCSVFCVSLRFLVLLGFCENLCLLVCVCVSPRPRSTRTFDIQTGVYFGMIGWIKTSLFPAPKDVPTSTKMGYDFVAGVTGGTLATLANTPFDVVSCFSKMLYLYWVWHMSSVHYLGQGEYSPFSPALFFATDA